MTQPPTRRFDILLTASEAYPVLEREFLHATHDIIAGFRIFDPWTTLRSDAARAVGNTWYDLITHTLNRGVRITLYISDFDPVARVQLHRYCWACVRGLYAAAEASDHPHLLRVHAYTHPARVGLLPRLLLWPRTLRELRKSLAQTISQTRLQRRDLLDEAPRLRALTKWRKDQLLPRLFPPPPLVPASHHQKLAVFDEQRLYVGGLDLNDRRFDTTEHRRDASDTWHDTQVLVDGPIAQEAAHHLRTFQSVACGNRPPAVVHHLLRTLSQRRRFSAPFLSPRTVVHELARSHLTGVSTAKTLIYLETQYFRDRTLARALALRARAHPNLTLILILPAAPDDAAFQNSTESDLAFGEYLQAKCIKMVKKAFGPRVFIGSPAQRRTVHTNDRSTHYAAPIIYLHAKVSVFDDHNAIISSANLNGRSFRWDTEVGVATQHPDEVQRLKSRCFLHWLGPDADSACFDNATACAAWSALAARNAARAPEHRQGFILPYVVTAAEKVGYNLPGVPDEMV